MKIVDIREKLMPMLDDAHWAETALENEDNQSTRRAYIRSLFGMIEGTLWILKQTILLAPVRNGAAKRLSPAEYALLSDKSYDLKGNGEPIEQTKFLRLPENLRFTFNIISKHFHINVNLHVGSNEWNKFLEAQRIRNRITHPKEPDEFNVTDSEIEVCQEACSWFSQLVMDFFDGIVDNHKKSGKENA